MSPVLQGTDDIVNQNCELGNTAYFVSFFEIKHVQCTPDYNLQKSQFLHVILNSTNKTCKIVTVLHFGVYFTLKHKDHSTNLLSMSNQPSFNWARSPGITLKNQPISTA